MIDRILVWFIPTMPPIMAFTEARNIISLVDEYFIVIISASGASFCHDDRIKHEVQLMDAITDGYHI
jgi:hypothetical protein